MAFATVAAFVEVLRNGQLLQPDQLTEVTYNLQHHFTDPRALAGELIQRGWLTRAQIEQLWGASEVGSGSSMQWTALASVSPTASSKQLARRAADERHWRRFVTVGAVLLALGVVGILFILLRPKLFQPYQPPPTEPSADAELESLLARANDAAADKSDLRRDLLRFRNDHPGTARALRALALVTRLPAPLDGLLPANIPSEERFVWQPPELAAVLGEHRWRHWGAVGPVACSPSGKEAATGGADQVVRLWELPTGREKAVLRGHTAPVWALAYAVDGQTLASGTRDGKLRLWDLATAREIHLLAGHAREITFLEFAPRGRLLASQAGDGLVKVWDTDSGKELWTSPAPVVLDALAWSPDGKSLALACDIKEGKTLTGAVKLWEVSTAKERTLSSYPMPVRAVAVPPDGKTLAIGTSEKEGDSITGVVKLWNVATGQEAGSLQGHTSTVSALAYSPNGKTLASACANDATVNLWDAATSVLSAEKLAAKQAGWEKSQSWTTLDLVSFTSNNGATFTKMADDSILVGGPSPDTDVYTIVLGTNLTGITALRLEVLPDKSLPQNGPGRAESGNFVLNKVRVAAADKNAPDKPQDVPLTTATADFSQGDFPVTQAIDGKPQSGWAVSPHFGKPHWAIFETKEAVGFEGGTLLRIVFDQVYGSMHTIGRFRLAVTTAPRPIRAPSVPDRIAAILSLAPATRSAKQKDELAAFYRSVAALRAVAPDGGGLPPRPFSRDGSTAVQWNTDGTVTILDVPLGKKRSTLDTRAKETRSLALTPDGKSLVSGSADGCVQLWDVATGTPLNVLHGHRGPVLAFVLDPLDNTLHTAGQDGTVRQWFVATGKERPIVEEPSDTARSYTFVPGGRFVASRVTDGPLKFWDLASGKERLILDKLQGPVAFDPFGRMMAVVSGDAVEVRTVTSGKEYLKFVGAETGTLFLRFSPDSKLLAAAGGAKRGERITGVVKLFDLLKKRERLVFQGHPGAVTFVAFSPDSTALAAYSNDGTLKVWHVDSQKELASIPGAVLPVEFSPDSQTIATGSADGTMKLWTVAGGAAVSSFKGPAGAVAFTPNGRGLLTISPDGLTLVVWEVASGKIVWEWQAPGPVKEVVFALDSRHLLSANANGTIYVVRLSPPGVQQGQR